MSKRPKGRFRKVSFPLAFLLFVVFFFIWFGVRMSSENQSLLQEQVVSRAEASNISSFLESLGNSVAILAQSESMERFDSSVEKEFDAFVAKWKSSGIVGGVLLADSQGTVRFNSNILGTHDVGANIYDREYFEWVRNQKTEGEYYIGHAIKSRVGGSKGKMVVAVVSPVFSHGKFAGAVVASVILDPLTKRFLQVMKVSGSTQVYLIGAQGDLLSSTVSPEAVGTNTFDPKSGQFLGNQGLNDTLQGALSKGTEGSLKTSYMIPGASIPKTYLLAYSPVKLNNRNWLIVMSTKPIDLASTSSPFFVRELSLLLMVFLGAVLFGLIIVRMINDQNKGR